MPAGLDVLKHVVCLMMENRSFDHMLGFLRATNYPIEGLSGNESHNL
jgi:phospholipase C